MTTTDSRTDHATRASHGTTVGASTTTHTGHGIPDNQREHAGVGHNFLTDQSANDAHRSLVGEESNQSASQPPDAAQETDAGGLTSWSGSSTTMRPVPPKSGPSLLDPLLALASDVLDDLERTRIANENRLRQMTRTAEDSDGEERGLGLDESHPDVARLAALVASLGKVEHEASLNLARTMRKHPMGPWLKAQRGIGEKQGARLLAVIGDPYINHSTGQPRTVSQLWAYSGLHVLPASHASLGNHDPNAGGDSLAGGDPSHVADEPHMATAGVAARRQKGQRANWSATAKSRAYLVAAAMLKAGNREVYDTRKTATEGRLHSSPCVRCGPAGKPAQPGSPWSDGHRHADALRVVSKHVLKEMWREGAAAPRDHR